MTAESVTITRPCPECGRDVEWVGRRVTPGDSTAWVAECECGEGE